MTALNRVKARRRWALGKLSARRPGSYLVHEVLETRAPAQAAHRRVEAKHDEPGIARIDRPLQPLERSVVVAEPVMHDRNADERNRFMRRS